MALERPGRADIAQITAASGDGRTCDAGTLYGARTTPRLPTLLQAGFLLLSLAAPAGCGDDATPEGDGGVGGDGGAGADGAMADGGPIVRDSGATPIGSECYSCHGNSTGSAPPADLSGNTDHRARGVGAHRSHLAAVSWHRTVICDDCHMVPTHEDDPGHMDTDFPAELTFSPIARADGAEPAFDGTSCTNTYCHGATLIPGGLVTEPTWTNAGAGEAVCGTCHGMPPDLPHPATTEPCSTCHPVFDESLRAVIPDQHIDGIVQRTGGGHPAGYVDPAAHGSDMNRMGLAECQSCHGVDFDGGSSGVSCNDCHSMYSDDWTRDCTFCHGGTDNPTGAPPEGFDGQTASTDGRVGAHTAHVEDSGLHIAFDCSRCHVLPTTIFSPAHIDGDARAEVTFDALNATAVYDPATGSCADLYCHGTRMSGGSLTVPTFTRAGAGEAACGTCHGAPPGAPHTTNTRCSTCHEDADDAGGISNPVQHVDGVLQVSGGGHPPGYADADVHGAEANDRGLDRCTSCHGADLTGGSSGVSCESCHGGWSTDCTFCHGGLDNMTGAPPEALDGATSVGVLSVGAHSSHVATTALHTPFSCSRCHGRLPASAFDSGHIDGDGRAEVVFDAFNAAGRYDRATGRCSSLYCHGATLSADGALTEPTWTRAGMGEAVCGTCHGMPPGAPHTSSTNCASCHDTVDGMNRIVIVAQHVDGIRQVSGGGHPPGYAAPTVHGSEANNAGIAGCQSCHGDRLDGGSVGVSCASCHDAGWTTDCTYCHGGTDNGTGAPPEGFDGETARSNLSVGAHSSHVQATALHAAFACERCHARPMSVFSAGHVDGDGRAEVAFDTLNPGASYTPSTGVCSNLYCHGNGSSRRGSQDWDTDPTLSCASCHSYVGSSGSELDAMSGRHRLHVRNESIHCSRCHSTVVSTSDTITNAALHLDGVAAVQMRSGETWSGSSCNVSCHGSERW